MVKAKPHLIIVTGRPAAGKTTLARRLAQELGLPLVSKDSIREVLFDGLGWKDRAWAQALGRASVDVMLYFARTQLEVGRAVILDNAFHPPLSTPRFQALKTEYHADTIQIICDADADVLFQRFKARAQQGGRHPGHGDEDVLDELWAHLTQEQSPLLDIGGVVIHADTTDFSRIDYPGILAQLKSAIDGP